MDGWTTYGRHDVLVVGERVSFRRRTDSLSQRRRKGARCDVRCATRVESGGVKASGGVEARALHDRVSTTAPFHESKRARSAPPLAPSSSLFLSLSLSVRLPLPPILSPRPPPLYRLRGTERISARAAGLRPTACRSGIALVTHIPSVCILWEGGGRQRKSTFFILFLSISSSFAVLFYFLFLSRRW